MNDSRFYVRAKKVVLGDLLDGHDIALSPEQKSAVIQDVSNLEDSQPDMLTYYGGRKYKGQLADAAGGFCLCDAEDVEIVEQAGLTPLPVKFARGVFALSISKIYQKRDFESGDAAISPEADIAKSAKILPGAVIGAGAKIGEGAIIGANSVIYPGVEIGAYSSVEANATVQCAVIGKHCKIHSNSSVGGDGFGIAPTAQGPLDIMHIGRVIIGDKVSIGYSSTIDRGMLGDTILADNVKIDNLCQVGHNCNFGEGVVVAGHSGISGSVTIGAGAVLAGGVGVADHVVVGEGAILAANSGHMKDVPAGEAWGGYPAKPLRQFIRECAVLSKMAKPKKRGSAS